MESKKTSKKSSKSSKLPIASSNGTDKELEVAKSAKRPGLSPSKPKPAESKKSAHRHSKLSTPVSPVLAPADCINYEEVAKLAYSYWEERHFAHGFAEEDWHRAELAVKARQASDNQI